MFIRFRPTSTSVNLPPVTKSGAGGVKPPPVRTGSLGSPHVASNTQNKGSLGRNPGAGASNKSTSSSQPHAFQTLVQQKLMNQGSVIKPFKPQVSAEPKSLQDVTQNLIIADRLVKAGVFKTSPAVSTVSRDAFIGAGVSGLVSAPISIGAYAGSVWTGEAIKAQYTNSAPMLPPAHQLAPSKQVPAAQTDVTQALAAAQEPDAGRTAARLGLAELRIEVMANNVMAMRQGAEAPALQMSDTSSRTESERLETLESLYKTAEGELKRLADESDMVFRPYVATSADGTDEKGRLDILDKKFEALNKFIGKLLHMKTAELPAETSETQVA